MVKCMDNFKTRFEKLNKQQRQAVETIDGPVMVIAGPGSGKTELLSLRVANILRLTDTAPKNILCLTFTDAAAFNMRQRLAGLIGRAAYRVAIHTFHSFGVEIINRYPEQFYGGASFLPADDITQTEILEEIFNGLDHDNPLRSKHNGQFVYLPKVKKAIEHLKKAGLSPAEFKIILAENKRAAVCAESIIQKTFGDRVSKKMIPDAERAAEEIKRCPLTPLPGLFKPFTQALADSLAEALNISEETNSTAPLSEWKKDWTAKNDDGAIHLADNLNMEKIEALAGLYEKYGVRMREEEYYDYNDMILDAIAILKRNTGIRLDLEEQYQYILVDEFQDTNDAQMRLLRLLTSHPIHEGRPNIMAVGDDDQAIYKFQGAEISNIIDFGKIYREPAVVVLSENYRSAQEILDAARHIIKKGAGRLENILPDVKKELVAANRDIKDGAIRSKEFPSREIEYQWIVKEAKSLTQKGLPAREIAIIAREHKELETLAPYFHAAKIPIAYERSQNALEEPLVIQLIAMARFVNSVIAKEEDADEFLPEILSYPFWEIKRSLVWEISIKARAKKKPWIKIMLESDGRFREIAEFFLNLGAKANHRTAEEVLHELIGGPQLILPGDDNDGKTAALHNMFSPFRSYYFSGERFAGQRAEYLRFLSSLQAFTGTLREYHRGRPVLTADMLAFVDTHIKNNLAINNLNPFVNAEDAVQLMTAHKAKGLEFEAVFVINCQESIWGDTTRGHGNLQLPMNLPISPAGDNPDDRLRLFYVAITRAKRLLYLVSYKTDQKGKESARLGFIAPEELAPKQFRPEFVGIESTGKNAEELLAEQWDARHIGPFVPDEKALLKPLLENYQLSVTHLQNFLNVADAGPLAFFEKNLLMFPEPKTASGALGSAIHSAIHQAYKYLRNEEKLPSAEEVLSWFEGSLKDQRLNQTDFNLMLKRGQKALEIFYARKKDGFSSQDKIEFGFKSQGAVVNNAHLTGKIDRMIISGSEIIVSDFKTGKPIQSWEPADTYEKIKAWKYRAQLVFYKLLIENSRDFGGKYMVKRGVIEFIEPHRERIIDLGAEIKKEETERMEKLINIVYKKIMALDFPNTSSYSKDIKGILAFEEDLLKNIP